jgi:sec-independent protein translocase protein TatA
MLQNIGTPELLMISAILFFLFGAKKLPELSRGIAESVREFKGAVRE